MLCAASRALFECTSHKNCTACVGTLCWPWIAICKGIVSTFPFFYCVYGITQVVSRCPQVMQMYNTLIERLKEKSMNLPEAPMLFVLGLGKGPWWSVETTKLARYNSSASSFPFVWKIIFLKESSNRSRLCFLSLLSKGRFWSNNILPITSIQTAYTVFT